MRVKHILRKKLLLIPVVFILFAGCKSNNDLYWIVGDGYHYAELRTSWFGSAGFELVNQSETDISFTNTVTMDGLLRNRHYMNGSGVAVADINGNGLVDIYFASLEGPNKLYENLGNFRFRDITEEAGVAHSGFNSTGVVFADVTGNGFPDLLISSMTEGNSLYTNDGTGKFTLKEDSGLGRSNGAHTMALADVNGNGFLDLYITNYRDRSVKDIYTEEAITNEKTNLIIGDSISIIPEFQDYFGIINIDGNPIRVEKGAKDELFLNQGDGTFLLADDMSFFFDENDKPVGLFEDWGLTATFADVTGNGLPDIYVANDFWTPDRFWINRGDGTFRLIKNEAIRSMSFSAMGVDVSDINRDGNVDIMVTEMFSTNHNRRMRQTSQSIVNSEGRALNNQNSVFLNRGDGTFAEIANYSGLYASDWSWATYFLDVNLNGYEDLIITNGYLNDYLDMDTQFRLNEMRNRGLPILRDGIFEYPELKITNNIFKNNGDLTFENVSNEWGFDIEDISLGMALADFNNDGTMDLVINRMNDPAIIYRNTTNAPRIAVRLNGKSPNTSGIGAKITLEGTGVEQTKQMRSGGNYNSGSQEQVVFAADKRNRNHRIIVEWPGGSVSTIDGVRANRIYIIDEEFSVHETGNANVSNQRNSEPLFADISSVIAHIHYEDPFDDAIYQPLKPMEMNRLGPGAAWIDITKNGLDDLLIATGKGGTLAFYENSGGGFLNRTELQPLTNTANGDQTALLSWSENDVLKIAVGKANLEQHRPTVPSAYIFTVEGMEVVDIDTIPGIYSTTGPLAAADINGNGRVDLFIGGRFVPTIYPRDADSRIFLNQDNGFVPDDDLNEFFKELGLVTGALFADFTGNGFQDLLVSREWGSLLLFANENGKFRDITSETGLDTYKGWWQGITIGDFTNNGLPDIVASNIGRNTPYQITGGYGPRMYYDDINWDGRLNIIEGYFDEKMSSFVPRRRLHDFSSIPTILQQVRSHTEYSEADLNTIFGVDFDEIPFKEINTLEHMVFLNDGETFTAKPLPVKAQLAAAFHVGVSDVDNDGNEDLFISQNNFLFPGYVPRSDAGRGLILKGDGTGNFTPLTGIESGIIIYGEQRGAAFSDFNRDGKTDIVVTQNQGETRFFVNQAEKKGITVKLKGSESNPDAIGSSVRLVYPDGSKGPKRWVLTASGYWSQNSKSQVLGYHEWPDQVEVIWPDGTRTSVAIEDGKWYYEIGY
jgi:enediyne biosynthesis protein E4